MALTFGPFGPKKTDKPRIESAGSPEGASAGETRLIHSIDGRMHVTLPLDELQALETSVMQLRQEIDDHKTDESIAWFAARGYTGDTLLSPESEMVDALIRQNEHAEQTPVSCAIASDKSHCWRGRTAGMTSGSYASLSALYGTTVRSAQPPAHSAQPGALRHKRKLTQGT
jgi:hypothetical protein